MRKLEKQKAILLCLTIKIDILYIDEFTYKIEQQWMIHSATFSFKNTHTRDFSHWTEQNWTISKIAYKQSGAR